MNKASNFVENRRNRKHHTKPYDRILEAPPIQVYSNTDVNILLSRNNYLSFGSTYPTGCFYKGNWLVNHKNQAALIKLSKNVSAVLLGDSIVAVFLRYPNIWYNLFDENTIDCGIGGDKIHPSTTIAGVLCNQLWHNPPGYRRFWKNSWWSFLYCTCPQEKNEPSQNCNKWNSTTWWTKYDKNTETVHSKRTAGKQVY